MFETTGTIDRKFYDRYGMLLYSKIIKVYILLWASLSVYWMLVFSAAVEAIIAVTVTTLIFLPATFMVISFTKKINLKRTFECKGKTSYLHTSYFEEDGVVVKDHALNSTAKIMYNNFVKFKKTETVWFLFTKAGLFVPVFVENFSDEEKENLLSFLRAHLPKVKKI